MTGENLDSIIFFNLFIKHISVLLHIFTESAYYILKNTIPTNFYIYVKDYLYQEQHIVESIFMQFLLSHYCSHLI
jgi:hypothetical protein